jgi:transposase
MSKRKNYDSSFRQQAVKLAISSKQTLASTAKELGIHEKTLYGWVSDAKNKKVAASNNKEIYPKYFNMLDLIFQNYH